MFLGGDGGGQIAGGAVVVKAVMELWNAGER